MKAFSLSYSKLKKDGGFFISQNAMLRTLKKKGIKSIELRTVFANENMDTVFLVAQKLWHLGFNISIHAQVNSIDTAIEDIFSPLKVVLENLRQRELIIVIHPLDGDNVGFFDKVIHTHIHGLNELVAHHPLNYDLPIELYFEKLSLGYLGVYNLELEFERLQTIINPKKILQINLKVLNEKYPKYALLYDEAYKNSIRHLKRASEIFNTEKSRNLFSLIQSASYYFNTGQAKWAVDIAFSKAAKKAGILDELEWATKKLDYIFLTHIHDDHFDK